VAQLAVSPGEHAAQSPVPPFQSTVADGALSGIQRGIVRIFRRTMHGLTAPGNFWQPLGVFFISATTAACLGS
jgi:hypothetical protein